MWPAWVRGVVGPLLMRPAAAKREPYLRRAGALLRRRAWSIVAYLAVLVIFDAVRSWQLESNLVMYAISPLWTMAGVAAVVPILVEATGLRGVRLVACIVPATLAAVGLAALLLDFLNPASVVPAVSEGLVLSNAAFLLRGWWLYSIAGLLFTAYCQTREREQTALRAARDAELERAEAQRQIVASRLKVLQARVEPELLFDALADVRLAYLHDPAAADALLDDLVSYLRAALPQMRGGASTLAREARLAEAYLRVVPAGRERRLAVEVAVPPALAELDFPPMVLLPLVHAVADLPSGQVRIAAEAGVPTAAARRVCVRVTAEAVPRGWTDEALHVVRETVGHYFGTGASLDVARDGAQFVGSVTWMPGVALPGPAAEEPPRFVPSPTVLSADSAGSSRTA